MAILNSYVNVYQRVIHWDYVLVDGSLGKSQLSGRKMHWFVTMDIHGLCGVPADGVLSPEWWILWLWWMMILMNYDYNYLVKYISKPFLKTPFFFWSSVRWSMWLPEWPWKEDECLRQTESKWWCRWRREPTIREETHPTIRVLGAIVERLFVTVVYGKEESLCVSFCGKYPLVN